MKSQVPSRSSWFVEELLLVSHLHEKQGVAEGSKHGDFFHSKPKGVDFFLIDLLDCLYALDSTRFLYLLSVVIQCMAMRKATIRIKMACLVNGWLTVLRKSRSYEFAN